MCPGGDDETVIEAELARRWRPDAAWSSRSAASPRTSSPAHGAGWQAHVEDLAAHVAGREPADWHTRWTELAPAYQAQGVDGSP